MTVATYSASEDPAPQLTFVQALFKRESVLFALICLTDLVTTLFFVHAGIAREANPLLAPYLRGGDSMFCIAKLTSFLPALLVCSWYRTIKPKFAISALRVASIAYLIIYFAGVGMEFIK